MRLYEPETCSFGCLPKSFRQNFEKYEKKMSDDIFFLKLFKILSETFGHTAKATGFWFIQSHAAISWIIYVSLACLGRALLIDCSRIKLCNNLSLVSSMDLMM